VNNLETDGYNVIMELVRSSHDPHDPWGCTTEWLFAICDYQWLINGEILPEYRPAPGLSLKGHDGWAFGELLESNIDWDDSDLMRVYALLNRYDNLLRLAGKNY